ncbi:uncharacterized protein RCO7_02246 [Rhynchosporium graminicola]|uniref:BTB domain-containing protein n=1 Tax=Rhynchosporium graminicola TaxID=2792576 RepID=A0A1E1LHF7_9HELO|nr:uncharacterized protein RCO7_02246 [Rhynchosporium commune]
MTSMTSVSADVAKSHQTWKYHQARKRRKTILPTYSDPKSLVTFLIGPGPNPVEFLIHKEIVCHNSGVLAVAFNGNFIEGRTQTYRIDDTTERAFKLFMQWLYSKSFTLVELWVLADMLLMPSLQNAIIDVMMKIYYQDADFPAYICEYVYQHTEKDSALRRLLVKQCTLFGEDAETLEKLAIQLPKEMLVDVYVSQILLVPGYMSSEIFLSKYYVSEESD